MSNPDPGAEPVRVPADVDQEDRVLAGLTARQAAILATAAVSVWLAFTATRHLIPPAIVAGAATPPAVTTVVVALGRRDGLSLDRWLIAGLRQARSPRRLVPAPEGVPAPPAWIAPPAPARARLLPAPLHLPADAISPDGTISLHPMREVPDVSALADPSTGMLVGETVLMPNKKSYAFALSRIGGTSVSCPTFAGIEADAQQAAGFALGFANPVIYSLYGTPAYHDVTDNPLGPGYLAEVRSNYTNAATKKGPLLYYLRTLGIDGEGAAALPATKGYDDATGVGSPAAYIQAFQAKAAARR